MFSYNEVIVRPFNSGSFDMQTDNVLSASYIQRYFVIAIPLKNVQNSLIFQRLHNFKKYFYRHNLSKTLKFFLESIIALTNEEIKILIIKLKFCSL